MRLASLIFFALPCSLVACTDDSDAGPGEPEPPPPTARVVVETVAPPAMITYRDGDGAWKTPVATSPTTFALDVTGPYRVTTVCDGGAGQLAVHQVARTPDDDRAVRTACAKTAPERVTVGGTMRQAGRVLLGTALATGRPSDGRFAISVPRGTYDLVATSDDAVAIYRDVVVDSSFMPPLMELLFDVDVAADGAPYVVPGIAAANAELDELVTASVWLDTGPTIAELSSGEPRAARFAPDAALLPTDRHLLDLSATRGAHSRGVFGPFRAGVDAPELALPAPIGPVVFASVDHEFRATWSELPAYDFLSVDAVGDGRRHLLEQSARHAAATGATAVAFETAGIAGFPAEWLVDLTRQTAIFLHAVRVTGEVFENSTYTRLSSGDR